MNINFNHLSLENISSATSSKAISLLLLRLFPVGLYLEISPQCQLCMGYYKIKILKHCLSPSRFAPSRPQRSQRGDYFWLDWERDSIKPNPHTLRVKFTSALKGHEVWTKLSILKILDTDTFRLSL